MTNEKQKCTSNQIYLIKACSPSLPLYVGILWKKLLEQKWTWAWANLIYIHIRGYKMSWKDISVNYQQLRTKMKKCSYIPWSREAFHVERCFTEIASCYLLLSQCYCLSFVLLGVICSSVRMISPSPFIFSISLLPISKLIINGPSFSSVQFSCSVVSDSLRPHGPQHARPPCPSPTPWVYPNSCPLSWWCHPTISSSVVPFSSCLLSFWASGTFKWVSSLHQVAEVLEFQLHQSFQWTPRTDLL